MTLDGTQRTHEELALYKALKEAEERAEMLGRQDMAHAIRVLRGRVLTKPEDDR
jgi:hypothetical protein